MELQFFPQPFQEGRRLGEFISTQLTDKKWSHFYAAIAFIKKSGVVHFYDDLQNFSSTNSVRIISGVDLSGTSIEGLQLLSSSLNGHGEVWIFHNENGSTFHPKIYLFHNDTEAILAVGSGNLTQGGMYTNYEASMIISLSFQEADEKTLFDNIITTLDSWSINGGECSKQLDEKVFQDLIDNDYIFPESVIAKQTANTIAGISSQPDSVKSRTKLFISQKVAAAPKAQSCNIDLPEDLNEDDYIIEDPVPVEPQTGHHNIYLMTLQRTDVGEGQTTKGASRRSPEIFIPLSARDSDPEFWGWDNMFTEDSLKPGKFDRRDVSMRLGGEIINVNMMTWPDKSDFRIRSEAIRSAGNIGDILKLERTNGQLGYQYHIEIIPSDSSTHRHYKSLCNNPVRNSKKEWGYCN